MTDARATVTGRAPALSRCGACGAPGLGFDGLTRYDCGACGWRFYRNPVAATFAILEVDDRVLLVRRGREPGAGTLDLPGGFVDPGESGEEGVRRELHEELGVLVDDLRYIGSFPNAYPYRGIVYETVDMCFHGRLDAPPERLDEGEIAGLVMLRREEIDLDEVGFPSVRMALQAFLAR